MITQNNPSRKRRRRYPLAIAAGVCALALSGTVQTSQFTADDTTTRSADPATPIGSGQALLDNQPISSLIGLPPGATMQDMLDFSTAHPAGPETSSTASDNSGEGSRLALSPAQTTVLSHADDDVPAVGSGGDSGHPLLLASATGVTDTIADPDDGDDAAAGNSIPGSLIDDTTSIAEVAAQNSASAGGAGGGLLDPQDRDNNVAALDAPTASIDTDVPEPSALSLFGAGLIVLTMVSGHRRRRRG